MNEPLVTMAELVKATGVPRWQLYRLAKAGKIPHEAAEHESWHQTDSKLWRFRVSAVIAALPSVLPHWSPVK